MSELDFMFVLGILTGCAATLLLLRWEGLYKWPWIHGIVTNWMKVWIEDRAQRDRVLAEDFLSRIEMGVDPWYCRNDPPKRVMCMIKKELVERLRSHAVYPFVRKDQFRILDDHALGALVSESLREELMEASRKKEEEKPLSEIRHKVIR